MENGMSQYTISCEHMGLINASLLNDVKLKPLWQRVFNRHKKGRWRFNPTQP